MYENSYGNDDLLNMHRQQQEEEEREELEKKDLMGKNVHSREVGSGSGDESDSATNQTVNDIEDGFDDGGNIGHAGVLTEKKADKYMTENSGWPCGVKLVLQ